MKKMFVFLVSMFLFVQLNAQEGKLVGDEAPQFEAHDSNGNNVNLSAELQKGKVVLIFYRGQWCPYCNRHMSALQDSLSMITYKGAKLIAITPEKNEEINKTVEKSNAQFSIVYDANHIIMDAYEVTFTMSKSKHLAYKTYGININEASGNDDRALPVPATYIIDTDGRITYRHFDKAYKNRASVKEILDNL